MERIYYYSDELKDDFAGTSIKSKPLPQGYRYFRSDKGFNFARFLVYRIFATPIILLVGAFSSRLKNKRVLRKYKKGGAFIYGNHTAYLSDAANPTRIAFPRTADVVVNPDAVSIKGCGWLVRLLGAVPVPSDIRGLKNFSDGLVQAAEKGHWIAVYPEAHIWPYYTGIRPFGAASFKYPAKCGVPVFAFTTTYKKRLFFRRPKKVVYVDGPFFADSELSLKARAESLREQVYSAMCERAGLSDCVYVDYYKINNPQLAAALNGAQAAAGARGRRYKVLRREIAANMEKFNASLEEQVMPDSSPAAYKARNG